ncbi:MAG: sigma 54-interacting transcriptional regulator [Chloroflexi bacterium]|nr:sigma 54-interacting transcriptional regulator [Chloroflexota bacterium]
MTAEAVEQGSPQGPEFDRAKRAFLAHMRHELRTPINAIIGYSELLLEDVEGEECRGLQSDLQKVNAAGKQLLSLVNSILDSSRIEATSEIRIEQFEAEVRHGMRTTINSVVGYADIILEDAAGREDLVADLQRIRSAGERMLSLTGDFLSLWQHQRQGLDLGDADGFQMAQQAVATIRPLAEDQARGEVEGGCLLVVDDNETNRDLLSRQLQKEGHRVLLAENGRRALDLLNTEDFDLVLLDILMPEMNGYQVLQRIKADKDWDHLPVIMLSALDDMDSVVRCIELGADDYLTKPFNPVLLRARIGACLDKKRQRDRELAYLEELRQEREKSLRELLEDQFRLPAKILGNTRLAVQLRSQAEAAAANSEHLLILGEAGTEKQTVAQLVHEKSCRAPGPFLRLDCAKVPAVVQDGEGSLLLEVAQMSALFGHQTGAFSFARSNRAGYIELAEGGTLVLENVERLTPAVQERLLAYLRTGKVRRLGASQEVSRDTRLIALSHNRLGDEHGFGAELHNFLSRQVITVPPLRGRKRDLMAWVDHFIALYGSHLGKEVNGITKEAMNIILAYDWPNNMEELEGVLQRGVRLADGPVLTPEQIFIGLVSTEPRYRLDLLKLPFLRRALESRLYPDLLKVAAMVLFGLVLLSALFGPQEVGSNLSLVLAWSIGWPFLMVGIFFAGRFFCNICPLGSPGHFLQRRWSLRLKVPNLVKQYGLYGAALGFVLISWVEQVTSMDKAPAATAILLISIAALATTVNMLFERAGWCRYLCPLGRMVGAYATLSLVEMRTNPAVCTAECKTHACYTGVGGAKGCPMYEGAFALQSNEACKFCAECLKSCENKAIRLNLRFPASEVWALREHSILLARFVPILMAAPLSVYIRGTELYRQSLGALPFEEPVYFVFILGLALGIWAAMSLAAAALGEPLVKGSAWLPYAFLPLAMAGEMVRQLKPLFLDSGALLPTLARQFSLGNWQFAHFSGAEALRGTQTALLLLGALASMYLAYRLTVRYRPLTRGFARLPLFLLVGLLGLLYGLLLLEG